MNLEDQRVAQEEEAERLRVREAEAARRRLEERRRQEEEQRLLAREEEGRRRELLRREEEARLEAIKLAEIETARRHAESDARRKMLARSHDHEQRMAALMQDRTKKRLRMGVIASALLAIGMAIGGAVWVQQTERRVAEDRLALELEAKRLQEERDREIDDLLQKIERSKGIESAALQVLKEKLRILEEEKRAAQGKEPATKGPPPERIKPVSPSPEKEICSEGDPMCDTLGR